MGGKQVQASHTAGQWVVSREKADTWSSPGLPETENGCLEFRVKISVYNFIHGVWFLYFDGFSFTSSFNSCQALSLLGYFL